MPAFLPTSIQRGAHLARLSLTSQVNFFAARFQRVFFYGQELSAEMDPVRKEVLRQTLRARFATYDREYTVMLFGYQVRGPRAA